MTILFQIILMTGNDLILSYKWGTIPVVGDVISIGNGNVFIVKSRLLSSDSETFDDTMTSVVILDGETKKYSI